MRYGGRDDSSADSHQNVPSLELALTRGLEQHELWKNKKLPAPKREAPKFVKDYPEIASGPIKNGNCVHCHAIGAGQTAELIKAGKLDKRVDPWVYPDVKKLGITLDAEKGTVVKEVSGAAKKAGFAAGDEITHLNNKPVLTFADLQYQLNKVPHNASKIEFKVRRGEAAQMLKLTPEKNWRVTNIERRGSAHRLEPFPEFWARPLSEDEKKNAGLKPKGFAAEVTKFWVKTNAQGAGLQVGDIVFSVDGVEEDELTESVTLFIKLNRKAGDTVKVGVLRRGNAMELSFKLKAKPW
jgi:predicted metalloprotease with PDZ domain